MIKKRYIVIYFSLICIVFSGCRRKSTTENEYAGSESCRKCHERFYDLWESSHHGKAMQPYSDKFAAEHLTAHTNDIVADKVLYRAHIEKGKGFIIETSTKGSKKYPIVHVMGGKNVFFFLTPLEKGRLQVAPISYNVRTKAWYDTTASMVRHFNLEADEAVHWTDPLLTFNTACFNCHVSQLRKNYDLETDTYKTIWGEPGINCESCHGPSKEHNRACLKEKGKPPKDLKLISWKTLTHAQRNDSCSICHAKMSSLTPAFTVGDKFFDHYDLVCLEDRDYYPDGRDLGENYTLTSWMMSPCRKGGKLDCVHCHTSSGRYRFKDKNHNGACLPCHKERVLNISEHSHHPKTKKGSKTCVDCHMPTTSFSHMDRSDHSMRPPSPEASKKFKSPNACIGCHHEYNDDWAADKIKKWHPKQKWSKKILHEGQLVQWARDEKWEHLREMLDYIQAPKSDVIVVTSLVRMLYTCPDMRKMSVLEYSLKHKSPLVRSAAVTSMGVYDSYAARAIDPLLDDEFLLVRVRAANTLMEYPREQMTASVRQRFEVVEKELVASLTCRPDHWSSQYNLGNYWDRLGQTAKALLAYNLAIRQRQDVILPYVNAAMAYSRLGNNAKAREYLEKAYSIEPENGAVNFNLGLLMAENKDMAGAEHHLRKAVTDKGVSAQAAYNLAVIVGGHDPSEAVKLCRKALESEPGNKKYQQALSYYISRLPRK